MLDAVQLLHPRFGKDYPIPTRAIPKWLVWLLAPAVGPTRRSVAGSMPAIGHSSTEAEAHHSGALPACVRDTRRSDAVGAPPSEANAQLSVRRALTNDY